MISLFEMGENGMVSLNKEWISMIPEFRRLLARDKGGPGDGSGKYKKKAQREFTYIYLMYDFRSPLENFNEQDREEESLRMSGLEKGQMNSDGDLWEAIRVYQKLQDESSKTLQTYRRLKSSVDDLTDYIDNMDLHERTFTGAKVHSPKEKQEAIIGMPKVMATLNEMEATIKSEIMGDTGLRGDATKGVDEDPE